MAAGPTEARYSRFAPYGANWSSGCDTSGCPSFRSLFAFAIIAVTSADETASFIAGTAGAGVCALAEHATKATARPIITVRIRTLRDISSGMSIWFGRAPLYTELGRVTQGFSVGRRASAERRSAR